MDILLDVETIKKLEQISIEKNKSSQEIVEKLVKDFVAERGL